MWEYLQGLTKNPEITDRFMNQKNWPTHNAHVAEQRRPGFNTISGVCSHFFFPVSNPTALSHQHRVVPDSRIPPHQETRCATWTSREQRYRTNEYMHTHATRITLPAYTTDLPEPYTWIHPPSQASRIFQPSSRCNHRPHSTPFPTLHQSQVPL